MKIAVIGFSGSGKSTLARMLGEKLNTPVLHLDTVKFMRGWQSRSLTEQQKIVEEFLKKESWIIDGNYSNLYYNERMDMADKIIFMNFNRFFCLKEAYKRYRLYRGTTRPDMAKGCEEKFDREFIMWILKDGRKRSSKDKYRFICEKYKNKVLVLKNRRQVSGFIKSFQREE